MIRLMVNSRGLASLVMVLVLLATGALAGSVAAAPAPPLLNSPANDATVATLSPTLSWQATAEASTYVAEVANNFSFNGRQSSPWSSSLSFTPTVSGDSIWFWRVKASGSGGSSDYSEVRHFWTRPTLSSPDNGATVSVTPSLAWVQYNTGSSTTRQYHVQIASDAAFSSVIHEVTLDGSAWGSNSYSVPAAALSSGQSYHWRVRASVLDAGGLIRWYSGWSDGRNFFAGPPGVPILTDPGDGAVLDGWRPVLTWNPVPGATSYKVHYIRTGSPEKWSGDLTATSYVLDTFWGGDATAESSSYEWWVEAKNTIGGTNSAHRSFATPARQQPSAPILSAPADTSTVSGLRPVFDWSDTTYTKNYRIQVGTGQGAYGITGQLAGPYVTDSSYSYPEADLTSVWPLEYNTTYYWQVTALSIGSTLKGTSPIWSFRTPPPAGPTLASPASGTTLAEGVMRPTLSWGAVSGAQFYDVQVATNQDFAAPLVVNERLEATAGESFTLATDVGYDELYHWRVRFVDSRGESSWSDGWTFRGPPPPIPFAPSPQLPGSPVGGSIVGFRPDFDWTNSGGATGYGFQLATNSGFAPTVVDVIGLTTSGFSLSSDLLPNTTYYWRTNAANGTGTSEWSTVFQFTTPPPPPAAPTLLAPSAGTTVLNLRPHFDWSDSTSATSYTFELYSDPGLSSPAIAANPSASEYDPSADLAADATYYWRVRGSNAASGPGPWTPAISFRTPTVPPPGTPILLSPADGALLDTLAPTLDWQDDANSTGYRYQIAKNNAFSSPVADGSVSSSEYARPTWASLEKNTLYYWRVRGTNAVSAGSWSVVRSFRTPSVPGTPSPVSPENGAAVSGVNPTLVVGSVAGATGYKVQLSTASWFPSPIIVESATTELAVGSPLSYGATYYWRAAAKNAAGESGWSVSRTFQTPPPPPPPTAPTLVAPVSGTVVGTARPSLDWNDVEGATKYRLEWSKSSTFGWTEAVRDNLTVSAFTLDVDLLFDTQYYWRVRATGEGGDSPWSPIFGFRTPAGPPGLPVLASPADGSNAPSPQQKLDWWDATAAESYQVQVSNSSGFETTLVDTTATTSEYAPSSPFIVGATYYWRVKAVNTVGETDWTAPWSFAVPEPPGAVTLVAPVDGSTVTTLRPIMDWEDLAAAASYEVWYSPDGSFGWGVTKAEPTASEHTVASTLPLDKDYYWKVRAINGGGIGPWSDIRRFHTPTTPPPATEPPSSPVLTAPAGGAALNNVTPLFSWEAAGGANGYHLQISQSASFGTLVSNDYTSATSHTPSATLNYSSQYYWRVQATNNIGSTNSEARGFTTPAPPPPPAPDLLFPAEGSTVDILSPTFDWADLSYANGYRIQVSTAADFSSYVINATVTAGSEYPLPSWKELAYSTSYYWRVQSYNNAGSGDWSPTVTFMTFAPPPPPPAPEPLAPGASGAPVPIIDSLKPTFEWAASEGASSYRIQVSRNEGFTSLSTNTTTSSNSYPMSSSSLVKGTQYWWRVQASNSQGTSNWSNVFSFFTPSVPTTPTLVSPEEGSTVAETKPMLQWSEVSGATTYHVTVASNQWFSSKLVDADVAVASGFTPEVNLTRGGTYYWRVNAGNAAGTSGWSSTGKFTVSSSSDTDPTPTPTLTPTPTSTPEAALTAPVLTWPGALGSTPPIIDTLKPTYEWNSSSGATSYRVQVSKNEAFTSLAINSTTTDTSFNLAWMTLATGAQHWWRVQAIGPSGTSIWSETFSFRTPSTPAVPSPASPANASSVTDSRPALQWSDVAGASKYQVMVGTNSWFGTKVVDTEVTGGTSFTFANDLSSGATYYWKVNAGNGAGTSNWSATWSFTVGGSSGPTPTPTSTITPTVTPTPTTVPVSQLSAPVLSAPGVAGGSAPIIGTLNPTYSWGAVAGATSYRIQVSRNSGFTSLAINTTTTDTSYTAPSWSSLPVGSQLWWKVMALNGSASSAWSAVHSFATPSKPATPILLSPIGGTGAGGLRPILDWDDVGGATSYHITVGTNSWFGTKVADVDVTAGSSFTPDSDLTPSTRYYWKVNASNAAGASGWSATESFVTPASP